MGWVLAGAVLAPVDVQEPLRQVYLVPAKGGDFVSHVYIVELETKEVRQLTHVESIDGSPAWSPDGRSIAFPSERSGVFNLWIQPVDGGEPTMVTDDPATDHGPEWSPDGKAVAFHSDRGGSSSIWILRREDGELWLGLLCQVPGSRKHQSRCFESVAHSCS